MTLVLTGVTNQVTTHTTYADVRYLLPVLPLGIALTAWAVCRLSFGHMAVVVPLAALVLFCNITHGGMFFKWSGMRSTTWCYAKELLSPNPEPYRPTADWLNTHAAPGATVYVSNGLDGCYPLMFLSPQFLYAWQFNSESRPRYKKLPAEHFKGGPAPDWLVAFGPWHLQQLQQDLSKNLREPANYELAQKINVFWKDLYRPELFWRHFEPVAHYNKDAEVVFIFRAL
jgi:hypothetical protein